MIKIQTATKISVFYPAGHSDEYIWADGQPWPIPDTEDPGLLKIEIFGPELNNERVKAIGGGESLKHMPLVNGVPTGEPTLTYRALYLAEAAYFSRQMRTFYPYVPPMPEAQPLNK